MTAFEMDERDEMRLVLLGMQERIVAVEELIAQVLQHTATHYNTLQHTTAHYNTLQHTATHCNTGVELSNKHASDAYNALSDVCFEELETYPTTISQV